MNKEESVAPGQWFTASSNDPDTLEETPGQFAASSNDSDNLEDTIQQLLDVREHYHQRAHSNISIAQERQQMFYDSKHDSNHVRLIKLYRI